MIRFQRLFTKYHLLSFFLLTYLLSWLPMPLIRGLLPHGVAFAAVIVIALSAGKPGLREFWKRLTKKPPSAWWFLVAPAIIISFILFNVISSLLAGGTYDGFRQLPFLLIAGELLLFGGQWEEPGWSGYALPALQKRFAKYKYGILTATLILGAFRGIWHLPLVIVGAIPWSDAVWFTPLVYQPFITWLYNKSGGSVLVVMFFHYMFNLLFAASPLFTGADKTLYTVLYMAGGGLATLILLWKTQFKLGWREDSLPDVKK